MRKLIWQIPQWLANDTRLRPTTRSRYSLEDNAGKLQLKVPKTKSGKRSIKLSKTAVDALHERWAMAMSENANGVSFVFCDSEGNPLRRSNFECRVWKPFRKQAGLPDTVHFHDLRHTAASWLLKSGINPKVIQEMLGHADISITLNTYRQAMPGMHEEAANTFDELLRREPQNGADGYKVATNSLPGDALKK